MQDPASKKKTKVAILGGGVAAMAAAFELTSPKNPRRDEFDVTVYQMGWRLGGKGASGRNARLGQRIQEHGLHIWFGCYENAFRVMRECYEELDRPAGSPLATWDEAFKRHSLVTLEELVDSQWKRWDMWFPQSDDNPGDGVLPSLWGMFEVIAGWLTEAFETAKGKKRSWIERLLRGLWELLTRRPSLYLDLFRIRSLARRLDRAGATSRTRHHDAMADVLDRARGKMPETLAAEIGDEDVARRFLILLDLSATMMRGLIEDGVVFGEKNFRDLDRFDFRAWLGDHGAKQSTLDSAPVNGYYALAFSYKDGRADQQLIAAGATLYGLLRMFGTYRGALMWKMQAGMGDTVFGPFYEVLKRRGVKFEFFRKVEALRLDADKTSVGEIDIIRQVDLKQTEYEPLVAVRGLPCWPSEPDYAQIVQGDELRRGPAPHDRPYNLESHWTSWPNVGKETLRRGEDFDQVILGISVGALNTICRDLVSHSPEWNAMVEHTATVPTIALQLWLKRTTEALGWKNVAVPGVDEPQHTVMDGYEEPLNTWADMTNLLVREDWPASHTPRSIAYFCGPVPAVPLPEPPDEAFIRNQTQRGFDVCVDWLNRYTADLWPKATGADKPGALDWALLVDPGDGSGVERMRSQYWRINNDPTEQYVLNLPGTVQYRMKSNASGYSNLILAGDWTDNGLNLGCVEAAAVSGLQASQALSGYPARLIGVPS